MKATVTALAAILLAAAAPHAYAEVPEWVKSNAGWWADGTISDADFVNGITHLIRTGLITVSSGTGSATEGEPVMPVSETASLDAELAACSELKKAYERSDCKREVNKRITIQQYKADSQALSVGPVTYYWKGIGSEGNEFEISSSGQPLLSIRMLAENGGSEIVSLNCTSPSICSYDVWDGSKSYRYSGMDFTNGQIVLNPGDAREFNILFGPNIGYGGTEFEYDPSKSYEFRISEAFGSASIDLNLG